MASELELRWLNTQELKGAAKRFSVFCKEDIKSHADSDDFDLSIYQDAVKLILSKLDHSLTLSELTKRIAAQEESSQDPDTAVIESVENDKNAGNLEGRSDAD